MADKSSTVASFEGLFFVLFIAIKLGGTSLVSWSWWWMLFPVIPLLAIVIQKAGL